MGITRKLNQLDYETGEVKRRFNSVAQACEDLNLSSSRIWYAIKYREGKMPKLKLRFEYAEALSYKLRRKVRQIDYYTNELIDEYKNIEDAAKDNFVTYDAVRHALNKNNGVMKIAKLKFEYIE